jgi:hypothetical protein
VAAADYRDAHYPLLIARDLRKKRGIQRARGLDLRKKRGM